MKVEIGALKLLYGTTNRCFIDTSGNSSKTKNKNMHADRYPFIIDNICFADMSEGAW